MKLQGDEVRSAVRTEGSDEETMRLKRPSMSNPSVLTEQPLESELLELAGEQEDGRVAEKMQSIR
ncbi:MAG: hypothetical protein U9Q68_04060 [Euryarchaeota archaeon]|nr:hypothetical protein [Euryarchaeota archaeon]